MKLIPRRSAVQVVTNYANELMRDGDRLDVDDTFFWDDKRRLFCQLHTLEMVCIKMGWDELQSKISKFKDAFKEVQPKQKEKTC